MFTRPNVYVYFLMQLSVSGDDVTAPIL